MRRNVAADLLGGPALRSLTMDFEIPAEIEATTGTTWRLVMNPTSSSAKTFVGSPMASVNWLP